MKCLKHPHSTDATAAACYNRRVGYKADKAIERAGGLQKIIYIQIKLDPPRKIEGPLADVYYFFTAVPKQ